MVLASDARRITREPADAVSSSSTMSATLARRAGIVEQLAGHPDRFIPGMIQSWWGSTAPAG
ncbi:MAG: hypothetical protein U1E61_15715 [Bradyrhizobium sp.]